jgi:tetratricopeptide (TPR) repeat protein
MQATPDFDTESGDRFAEYVRRGLRFLLQQVQETPGVLAEELREQSLSLLNLSLPVDGVWTQARDLLLSSAPKMEQAGLRDEWFPFLEAGLRQSERLADRLTAAELYLQLGMLHRLHSDFDESAQFLMLALSGFVVENDSAGQARTLNQLAYLDWQTHRYDEATRRADQAMLLLSPDDLERAMSLSALGLVAIDQGKWQRAEALHREALTIRTAHGDQRRMAWSLQNLGYALRGQGKYAEAIDCYERAIVYLEQVHDPAHAAVVRMNLGIAHSLAGDSSAALAAYAAAEATFRHTHDQHNLAKTLTNRGLEYAQLQEWKQAEHCFAASVALHGQLGDLPLRLNALDGLALAYQGQQQFAEAEKCLHQASEELPKIAGTAMFDYLTKTLAVHLDQVQHAANA